MGFPYFGGKKGENWGEKRLVVFSFYNYREIVGKRKKKRQKALKIIMKI